MKNDVNELAKLAIEIFDFDHTYRFSDDHRVWKREQVREIELMNKASSLELSIGEKIFIIGLFQRLWDENHSSLFASIDKNDREWVYKSSMYFIAGITDRDLLFSPIQ